MEQQFLANENRLSSSSPNLEMEYMRVKRRSWKNYTAAVAIVGASIFGAAKGYDLIAESKPKTSEQSRDDVKFGLGALLLAFAAAGGIAGTAGMAPRFSRDQRYSERIEASQEAGNSLLRMSSRKNIYRLQADGRYETFGVAEMRLTKTARLDFAEAVGLVVVGGTFLTEAAFGNHSVLGGVLSAVSLVGATAQTVAGMRHTFQRKAVEADIAEMGAGTRLFRADFWPK